MSQPVFSYKKGKEMETITLAEVMAMEAAAQARSEGAPYETLFRAVLEIPDTSGGSACLRILLGLYNGTRFKVDLTDLRCLDAGLHAAAIAAMRDEVGCAYYVHDRIASETGFSSEDVQAKLEWLAYEFDIPGRAKKGQLPVKPGRFVF